jgi:hypothetical protein
MSLAASHEPLHLNIGTLVPENAPLDLALGTDRLNAFDGFGGQIVDGGCFRRYANQRVQRETSNRARSVVPGLGSHVRCRDDRPDAPASDRKGALDESPTDALRLMVGQDEELGQFEQAVALDRAREADELPRGRPLGDPPLSCLFDQQAIERLARLPPVLCGSPQGRSLACGQVRDRRPHQLIASHRVIWRGWPITELDVSTHRT